MRIVNIVSSLFLKLHYIQGKISCVRELHPLGFADNNAIVMNNALE